jgi:hypothetical protein
VGLGPWWTVAADGWVVHLTGVKRAAASGYRSSPWQREKEEDPMGVLTEVKIGRHDDG